MSESSVLERLQQEAQKALVSNAFFRWESAVMIGVTILLTAFLNQPFPGWPVWAWPALGVAGEIAIVVSALTDKGEQQRVVESLFREKYNVGQIRDRALRAQLAEAEQYRQHIQDAVAQQPAGILRDRMLATTGPVYDWIANMVRLARRIETFRRDDVVQRDRDVIPKDIRELKARLGVEANPRIREQIEQTLASKQQLGDNLDELDARMQRAELQLEHSLAALGTVYSQLLLVGSKDVDSDRAERLRDDIRSEVSALQDLVESLNEVYGYESRSVPETEADVPASPQGRQDIDRSARR